MNEPRELLTYLNGKMVPHDQAVAALQDNAMQSASGFYDAERTFNGKLFKLHQHLKRLYRGLEFSQIDPGMALDEMETLTQDVLSANRPFLATGDEFTITQMVSLNPATSSTQSPQVNVVIYCQPLDFSLFATSYIQGVRLITPTTYGVPRQSRQGNGEEGEPQVVSLMTNREGSITECVGANFMFVRDGRIKLPDRRNVLAGVSMQTMLELAVARGIPVDEGEYLTHDVYVCDEAFITSTRYCMLPVATLNGLRLGEELPGPVTDALLDAWGDMVGVDFVKQALDHLPS